MAGEGKPQDQHCQGGHRDHLQDRLLSLQADTKHFYLWFMGTEGWPLIAQCSDDGLKCTKDAEHLDDASAFDDRHIDYD